MHLKEVKDDDIKPRYTWYSMELNHTKELDLKKIQSCVNARIVTLIPAVNICLVLSA